MNTMWAVLNGCRSIWHTLLHHLVCGRLIEYWRSKVWTLNWLYSVPRTTLPMRVIFGFSWTAPNDNSGLAVSAIILLYASIDVSCLVRFNVCASWHTDSSVGSCRRHTPPVNSYSTVTFSSRVRPTNVIFKILLYYNKNKTAYIFCNIIAVYNNHGKIYLFFFY